MSKVESKKCTSRSWPSSVDMFQDWLTDSSQS